MSTPIETVVVAVKAWNSYIPELVVALDGHGAAGKSTLAAQLEQHLDVAVVHADDFFKPEPLRQPDADSGAEDPMARYYDWDRLREEVLVPLREGREASFHAYDEATGQLGEVPVSVSPAPVIVLEGVSSAAPALGDLVDRTILVHTPADERLRRLKTLIEPGSWDEDWLQAEDQYFTSLGASHFDLTVSGASD